MYTYILQICVWAVLNNINPIILRLYNAEDVTVLLEYINISWLLY